MRLPRWLSSVRTVEAETGWPRELCREVLRRGNRPQRGRAQLLYLGGAVAAAEVAMFCSLAFTVLFIAALIPLGHAVFIRTDRTFIRRYGKAPWCLNCKYPVCPPREPGAGSVCPECGEPIAPEIARLAARDAEAAERISE
ncbi:MAG: hypothetical protein ACF8R7_02955 [Phycisphaerales bacterium JB039]